MGIFPTIAAAWQATTFAELIQRQAPGLMIVAQIRAYEQQNTWTATPSTSITYQVPIAQYTTKHGVRTIDTVLVSDPASVVASPVYAPSGNGIVTNLVVPYSLTQQTSIATVDANPGSFWHDLSGSGNLYISLPTSASPAPTFVRVGFLLYFSPGSPIIAQGFSDPTGNQYWPYLQSVPQIRRGLSNPFFGVVQQGTSRLSLIAASGLLDDAFSRYDFESGDVTVYLGGDALPFAEYQQFVLGKIEKAHWDENSISFDILDPNQQLLLNFPQTVFTTADATMRICFVGGYSISPVDIEPTAATTRIPIGSPKPAIYGRKINYKPVLVATTTSNSGNIYSLWCIAHHPCQYVESVTQANVTCPNGTGAISGYGTGSVGGAFDFWISLDNTYILMLGASPWNVTEQLYVTVRGKMNADGSLMDNPADIVQDIITVEGPGQAYPLDQTILAASQFVCNPYRTGLAFSPSEGSAPMRIIDAIDRICRDTLSYFYVTTANQFAFRTWWPSIASQQVLDENWGDFLASALDRDASRLYETIFCEYAENPLLWVKTYTSPFAASQMAAVPPLRQTGPSNFSILNVNRPECAAVIQNRNVTQNLKGTMMADQPSAWTMASRFARFVQAPAKRLSVTTKIRQMLWDLFQAFTVSKARFPQLSGMPLNFEAMEIVRDFTKFTLSLKADDCRVIPGQTFYAPDCTLPWSSMTDGQKRTVGVCADANGYALTTDPASYATQKAF